MARILCSSISRSFNLLKSPTLPPPLSNSFLLSCCRRSAHSGEVPDDDDSTSATTESPASSDLESDLEAARLMMRKMDEGIQVLLVQKATPDWIPFLPGSSFWVPPRAGPRRGRGRRRRAVMDAIKQIDQTPDETLSPFTSSRGWPCMEFFTADDSKISESVEVEVEIVVIDPAAADDGTTCQSLKEDDDDES